MLAINKSAVFIFLVIYLLVSCKKDFSYEGGIIPFMAKGSLLDSLGNCQSIKVNGAYIKDSELTADNYITVNANITAAGSYHIYSDTVNGCWFMDSGTVAGTGPQRFKLRGYGKPMLSVFGAFTVYLDSTVCSFSIPAQAAVYSFNAPAGVCPVMQVNGKYLTGAVLNVGNTVEVPVYVSVPGTYAIQTATENGISFSAKGVFGNTGNTNITLTGIGYPVDEGTTIIPLTISNAICNFPVSVLLDTSMYWRFTAEGVNYSEYVKDSIPPIRPITYVGFTDKLYNLGISNFGTNATNSYLSMGMGRVNHLFTTGIYIPGPPQPNVIDFGCSLSFNSDLLKLNGAQYSFRSDSSLHGFAISVSSYDPVSGLVEGSFNGPVYKGIGTSFYTNSLIVNITNGYFKAYLAH